ncbi:MAG TPA: outer membrane protein transport protein [Thermoanaerobaculia bacterium]|nr:outer membrane protein transport protein [Thermoanaerobaculia bacterium]
MFKAIGTRLAALVLVGLAVALPAARLEAAGFALFEQGAKATAMGGAFAATADDPSAMFFNPAGNAFNDKFEMMGGAFLVLRPTAHLDGENPYPGEGYSTNMKKGPYWFGYGYGVLSLSKDVKLSLGFWSPNGLGVPWQDPDTFRGRYIAQRTDLRQLAVSAQLAFKLSDAVAIGGGPELRITDVKLSENLGAVNPFTQRYTDIAHTSIVSTGTPIDITWTAGVLIKPCDRLRVGLSYHAGVKTDLSGYAQFGQILTGNPQFDAAVSQQLPFGKNVAASTSINFPSVTAFGIAYDLTPKVTLEVDGNYVGWSTFQNLAINIEGLPAKNVPQGWQNTWAVRAGASYKATGGSWLAAGFLYDQTPQPDSNAGPLLPDSNRTGVTIGGGIHLAKAFELQFSSMFLWFHQRTITTNQDNFSATYQTFAILPNVGFKSTF